jgi:hypothetical protein
MLFDRLGDTWFDTYGSSATIITYPSTSATAIAYSNPTPITSRSQDMAEVGDILGKKRTRSITGIVGDSSSKRPRATKSAHRWGRTDRTSPDRRCISCCRQIILLFEGGFGCYRRDGRCSSITYCGRFATNTPQARFAKYSGKRLMNFVSREIIRGSLVHGP